jgi:membrane fusion protein (multidrug efflux system)
MATAATNKLRPVKDMSDKALKIVPAPEAKASPDAKTEGAQSAPAPRGGRKRLRMILLVVLPALALIGGGLFYMMGGRYIETDNAYVGAQKVLITPEISGKIVHVAVREGQHVQKGDELFTLDRVPYQLKLSAAQGKLAAARSAYDKLMTSFKSLNDLIELGQKNVDLKRRDYDRKAKLVQSQAGSQADLDTSSAGLVTAQLELAFTKQQRDTTLNQLMGNANLPLDEFPEYAQAKAGVDDAERDLRNTVVRAPIAGIATQVDSIQLGRFVAAGTPVFSVVDDETPWVDANPKETDITYLRIGQKVTLDVDSFPDHTFTGTVTSVSPGTGEQFSILPPQNASGNWVKVVQRVPVRISFDKDSATRLLRAGMSVNVSIDTHHSRWPSWLGGGVSAKETAN